MRLNQTLKVVLMAAMQLQDSLRRFIELLRGAIDEDGEKTVQISYVELEKVPAPMSGPRGRRVPRGGGHP